MAGAGVLGYLKGSGADATFVSLAERLPPAARQIDELRCAVAIGQTGYFPDAEKILAWREEKFAVISFASPPEAHGARLHRVGDTLYVTALGHALGRVEHDRVEPVADDPAWRARAARSWRSRLSAFFSSSAPTGGSPRLRPR